MRFGAISKINPVILEFTMNEKIFKNSSKNTIGATTPKFNDVLVKFMFNLEYGNICKY